MISDRSISVAYFMQFKLIEHKTDTLFKLYPNVKLCIKYVFILTVGILVILSGLYLNS